MYVFTTRSDTMKFRNIISRDQRLEEAWGESEQFLVKSGKSSSRCVFFNKTHWVAEITNSSFYRNQFKSLCYFLMDNRKKRSDLSDDMTSLDLKSSASSSKPECSPTKEESGSPKGASAAVSGESQTSPSKRKSSGKKKSKNTEQVYVFYAATAI